MIVIVDCNGISCSIDSTRCRLWLFSVIVGIGVSTGIDEDIFRFWIDFFNDAINSNSTSSELPAQVPVCFCFFCK